MREQRVEGSGSGHLPLGHHISTLPSGSVVNLGSGYYRPYSRVLLILSPAVLVSLSTTRSRGTSHTLVPPATLDAHPYPTMTPDSRPHHRGVLASAKEYLVTTVKPHYARFKSRRPQRTGSQSTSIFDPHRFKSRVGRKPFKRPGWLSRNGRAIR
jgi:hypothetical protein